MHRKVSKEITLILVMAVFLTLPLSVVPLSHAQSNQDMQGVLKIHNESVKVPATLEISRSRGATVSQPKPRDILIN